MKTEPAGSVAAAKILASTILVGVGAVGLFGDPDLNSVRTLIAAGLLILGLWLLLGAWTGRTVGARLYPFYLWMQSAGTDSPGEATGRRSDLPLDKEPRTAS
jgi:protein-S-isoprenylcysteine O-methyltransferase Ste14